MGKLLSEESNPENKNNLIENESLETIKKREIKRLTSHQFGEVLEPKRGILTDDEILIYASESEAASKIRLKRGGNDFQDKISIYKDTLIYIWGFGLVIEMFIITFAFFYDTVLTKIICILVFLFLIACTVYYLYFKDYTEQNVFTNLVKSNAPPENDNNIKGNDNAYQKKVNNLEKVFNTKVKIVKELIEEKFPSPQLTNDNFNNSVDECINLFNSQLHILNKLLETNSDYTRIEEEIEDRITILQKIINLIDDLTNELIIKIGEESTENIDEILENMDNLINSLSNY